ncbi:MAG: hypothetical protein COZ75_07255 [Flavobacteriaceae bacterium CG_4_8_14_3_um_filter_34_10]|nr:MAG: hypothetical protein COS19_00845 [Flavobacteriaceae bacterium CG02_land_8_20_14_3_00_34_13]PIX09345.1 MAG: hypothetical protein COZ75_07255 [Flavobacteriaceae bacterium CG_4_8_14_3_um_filter_34_10]
MGSVPWLKLSLPLNAEKNADQNEVQGLLQEKCGGIIGNKKTIRRLLLNFYDSRLLILIFRNLNV